MISACASACAACRASSSPAGSPAPPCEYHRQTRILAPPYACVMRPVSTRYVASQYHRRPIWCAGRMVGVGSEGLTELSPSRASATVLSHLSPVCISVQ
eukprot:2797460-Rhodomonas_salina.1